MNTNTSAPLRTYESLNPFHKIAIAIAEALKGRPVECPRLPLVEGRGILRDMLRAIQKVKPYPADREYEQDLRTSEMVDHAITYWVVNRSMFKHFREAMLAQDVAEDIEFLDYRLQELVDNEDDIPKFRHKHKHLFDFDDDFDGLFSKELAEDAADEAEYGLKTSSRPARPAKAAKAAKSAKARDKAEAPAPEKPKKAPELFAKYFEWIAKTPTTAPRRLLLAELVRFAHQRPFTWVGNEALADIMGVTPRQIQKQLRALHNLKLITIRDYRKSWCKTQRIIFINKVAEAAGVDPLMELPTSQREFFRDACRGATSETKTDPIGSPTGHPIEETTSSLIGSPTGHPIETPLSSIGCPVGASGDVQQDTRRDKRDFLPLKRQRKSLSAHDRNRLRLTPSDGSDQGGSEAVPNATPTTEFEAVRQSEKSSSRPPMDWPKNLPADEPERELAKIVRRKQVTHLHPSWFDRWKCYMVRVSIINGEKTYHLPKTTADGWMIVTNDSEIVPLIDSQNRRIDQGGFIYALMTTGIKAPDQSQPVRQEE